LYGPELVGLFRLVKAAFDPDGILNPGVKLGSGGQPLSDLKVGAEAAPIPDDIAQALRDIERSGGYGRSRLAIAGAGAVNGEQGTGSGGQDMP
jgi:hypothetical protein